MLVDSEDDRHAENLNGINKNVPQSVVDFKDVFSTKSTFKELTGHKKRVYTLDWNNSGSRLASGSVDCSIRVWTLGSEKGYELKGHSDSVTNVKFADNDENLLISCSSDKTVKLWDVRSNKSIKSEKAKGGCKNLVCNANSSIFAFSNKDDDAISFYDIRKFQIIKQVSFKNKISEFEFDKSNSVILVTSSVGSISVLNAHTFDSEPLAVLDAHFPPVNTLNINKTNTLFATGAADALICLWSLPELLSYKVIKKGEIPIRKVMFSHDSALIAAIYEGNNLDIFDTNTTDCVYSILTENPQYSIAWNPNSYILAYSGDDKNRNNVDEGNIHLLSVTSIN